MEGAAAAKRNGPTVNGEYLEIILSWRKLTILPWEINKIPVADSAIYRPYSMFHVLISIAAALNPKIKTFQSASRFKLSFQRTFHCLPACLMDVQEVSVVLTCLEYNFLLLIQGSIFAH